MKKLFSVLLAALSLMSYALIYAETVNTELSSGLLRMHIIANSDSEEDQSIKLGVRDFVSKGLSDCGNLPSSPEYVQKAELLANEYLAELCVPYSAKASKERVFIPKKSYKNITLPSGRYNAIRLVLGDGEGQNWWCVAYPPLCFTEDFDGALSENGEDVLKENISEEAYSLISGDVRYRLLIVDVIGGIIGKIE